MPDEMEFRNNLARESCDAIFNLWVVLAESLVQSGVVRVEVLRRGLEKARDEVAKTAENSMTHYVLHRAAESYARDDGPDGPPKKPVWFNGVVDGGKVK